MTPDLLQDFETFFIDQGVLTASIPFYKDTILESSAELVAAIYEYSGGSRLPQVAGATRTIQFVARSRIPLNAKGLVSAMYKALDSSEDGILQLTADRWCTISLQQTPFKFKTDEKDRSFYCFNAVVTTYID